MKELIIAVATLALSGITLLAYKHPDAYEKLKLPSQIFNVGYTAIIAGFMWYLGINGTHKKLLPFIPKDKQVEALAAVEAIKLPQQYVYIILLIWFLLWLYLLFLAFLPFLLRKTS